MQEIPHTRGDPELQNTKLPKHYHDKKIVNVQIYQITKKRTIHTKTYTTDKK